MPTQACHTQIMTIKTHAYNSTLICIGSFQEYIKFGLHTDKNDEFLESYRDIKNYVVSKSCK